MTGAYHAAKFGIEAVGDVFRQELRPWGIPPEKVAATIERALSSRRPRSRYLVGLDAKLQARLKPLIPTRVMDRIVARAMNL
jgi:hypothetical protein